MKQFGVYIWFVSLNFDIMLFEEFINIHPLDFDLQAEQFRANNNRREIYETLELLQSIREDNVDIIQISQALARVGIHENHQLEMSAMAGVEMLWDAERLCRYLRCLLEHTPVEKIYVALQLAKYCKVSNLVLIWTYGTKIRTVVRVDLPFSSYVHRRYHVLKTMIDNNCFKENREQVLKKLSDAVHVELPNDSANSGNIDHLQKKLEEKVTIDLHRVQLYGPDDTSKRLEILQTMSTIVTTGLDRSSLELILNSKHAVTYAKMGDFGNAARHIQTTRELCAQFLPSFYTVLALNDVIYALQELCFTNRTPEILEQATSVSEVTYHISGCSIEEVRFQWKRIVLLFQAMTYLHISHEFQVGDIALVDDVSISVATAVLDEVQGISRSMEIRRTMVFNLCKARIFELSDLKSAVLYITRSNELTQDGCLRASEKRNIEKYHRYLLGKYRNRA